MCSLSNIYNCVSTQEATQPPLQRRRTLDGAQSHRCCCDDDDYDDVGDDYGGDEDDDYDDDDCNDDDDYDDGDDDDASLLQQDPSSLTHKCPLLPLLLYAATAVLTMCVCVRLSVFACVWCIFKVSGGAPCAALR